MFCVQSEPCAYMNMSYIHINAISKYTVCIEKKLDSVLCCCIVVDNDVVTVAGRELFTRIASLPCRDRFLSQNTLRRSPNETKNNKTTNERINIHFRSGHCRLYAHNYYNIKYNMCRKNPCKLYLFPHKS